MACPPYVESVDVPTAPSPLCHYVIVRRDLPLGILAAQCVHAAGESSPGNLPEGTHAVVLSAVDERALRVVAAVLARHGVPHVRVEEPDAPFCGALMAVGVMPCQKEAVRKHLSQLPLLK